MKWIKRIQSIFKKKKPEPNTQSIANEMQNSIHASKTNQATSASKRYSSLKSVSTSKYGKLTNAVCLKNGSFNTISFRLNKQDIKTRIENLMKLSAKLKLEKLTDIGFHFNAFQDAIKKQNSTIAEKAHKNLINLIKEQHLIYSNKNNSLALEISEHLKFLSEHLS
jgi:hypothetical protein